MARLEWQFRQLNGWPNALETPGDDRLGNVFRTKFPATLRLMAYELHRVGAINPVMISTGHTEKEIRLDGLPRTDIKPPEFPGVVIEFVARPGRLLFATDKCKRWEHNLHAIALTMEWLRGVDRYGAAGGDRQYAGFKALPPPGAGSGMTVEDAAVFIANEGGPVPFKSVIENPDRYRAAYRRAAAKLHPDAATSDPAKWALLQQAQGVMDLLHVKRR